MTDSHDRHGNATPLDFMYYTVTVLWCRMCELSRAVAPRSSPQNVAHLAQLLFLLMAPVCVALRFSLGLFLDVSTDGADQTVTGLQLVQEHSAAKESKYRGVCSSMAPFQNTGKQVHVWRNWPLSAVPVFTSHFLIFSPHPRSCDIMFVISWVFPFEIRCLVFHFLPHQKLPSLILLLHNKSF